MGKDLFNDRISRFSIRKLNVGVCSNSFMAMRRFRRIMASTSSILLNLVIYYPLYSTYKTFIILYHLDHLLNTLEEMTDHF